MKINLNYHNNFIEKAASIENEQLNNIYDNNKRKIISRICDYYSGYDEFLSKKEKNTIDLSDSKNYIKKEKLNEMINKNLENYNSNIIRNNDFINNICLTNNNKYKLKFMDNTKNFKNYANMKKIIAKSNNYTKFILYNKY